MISIIPRSTNFYSELYVHLLCEFSIMLDYDEMNYNLVSRKKFIMYFEMQILVICNNHEFYVGMNYNVKFVEI
jgi:hypothetical protein